MRANEEKEQSQYLGRNPTYSDTLKKNLTNTTTNPEIEIVKGQIQAIQTEMNRFRTELGKIKTLEKKVDDLKGSVTQIQTSLSSLNQGPDATNNKLDKLIDLIWKLPKPTEQSDAMEEGEYQELNPTAQRENNKHITPKATITQDKTIKPNVKRLQVASNTEAWNSKNKLC